MRCVCSFFLLFHFFINQALFAQLYEDAQDGNLTANPAWLGTTDQFQVNSKKQIQLAQTTAAASYLSLYQTIPLTDTIELTCWIRQNLAGSSANYSRLYLKANQSDLGMALDGLYLQLGESGSQDAIRVMQLQNGQSTELAAGPAAQLANPFQLFFRCRLTTDSLWVETKSTPGGPYMLCISAAVSVGDLPYSGFYCTYSASNASNFYLDDWYWGPLRSSGPEKLLITEIMADPDPAFNLPAVEYIEVYNPSNTVIQLNGYKLCDGSGCATLPSYWLFGQHYALLVGTSNSVLFNSNNVLELPAFPSFANAGDAVLIQNANAQKVDSVYYTSAWYHDELAVDGGFSLERMQLHDPCSDQSNWRASPGPLGGTPGAANAANSVQPDLCAPSLKSIQVRDSSFIDFYFSEALDTLSLQNVSLTFTPPLLESTRVIFKPDLQLQQAQFRIQTSVSIPFSQPIEIQLNALADCWQNDTLLIGQAIRYEQAHLGSVLLNELLFNPVTDGADFIELINPGEHFYALRNCGLHNSTDSVFFDSTWVLGPHELLALGPDISELSWYYPCHDPLQLKQVAIPAMNNDSGQVVLFCNTEVIDALSYHADWQLPLLRDQNGVSLERIRLDAPTQDPFNWQSAAQACRFATPGNANSQAQNQAAHGTLSLSTEELSPDQDAYHDFLECQYELLGSGLIGTAFIADLNGQPIRELFSNELLGTSGSFKWDGCTNSKLIALPGIYILSFSAFSTDGSVFFHQKKAFSLALKP
ncbi:MAG: hypothetical protein RLZZ301_1002 [Bacteroidota bacterium]|jgi:hypothetical protein